MSQFNISKVNTLPETLVANTIYLVSTSETGLMEVVVSDKTGTSSRHVINKAEIQALINSAVAAVKPYAVEDITARDALATGGLVNDGQLVLVTDATGDDTVAAGAAMYFYKAGTPSGTWVKIAEYESLDVEVTWDALTNKPTSTVAQIDAAVTDSHTHDNKALLDTLALNENNALTFSYGSGDGATTVELGSSSVVVASTDGVGGSAGLMTAADKEKLDGIEAGAEANEDVFGNVKVGSTTIVASSQTDTLELASTTDALTLSVSGKAVNFAIANAVAAVSGEGGTAGLFTGAEKEKLAGIEEGAEVNENVFGNVQAGDVTIAAATKTDTVKFAGAGAISASADAATKTVTYSIAASQASTGGQGGQAGTMSATQAEDLVKVRAQKQFASIAGNTGTVDAANEQDTVSIVGAGVVSVAAADKTLTISVPVAVAPTDTVDAANGLITGAEKAKLAAIEAGAEVNQNALATVTAGTGSWSAAEASDALSIVGGTAVSTSISSDTLTITVAEAQSASGSNDATSGLMSSADKAKLDKFTVSDGVLSYDGTVIGNNLVAEEW